MFEPPMPVVRILVLGPHGAYSRRQKVAKDNLGAYVKISFRGKPTYARKAVISELAQDADARRDNLSPVSRGGIPRPPSDTPGIQTEEFFVRDDYKGRSTKRGRDGKSKGRNPDVSVDVRVSFTGTRRERDEAFDRLEQTFIAQMPFLTRRGGLIGREFSSTVGTEKVRVTKSQLNGRANRQMARSVFFELEGI